MPCARCKITGLVAPSMEGERRADWRKNTAEGILQENPFSGFEIGDFFLKERENGTETCTDVAF